MQTTTKESSLYRASQTLKMLDPGDIVGPIKKIFLRTSVPFSQNNKFQFLKKKILWNFTIFSFHFIGKF